MSNQWLKILWSIDEGKRRNEFAEWHVAWLVERHNYAAFNLWKMAQRNKLSGKHARVSAVSPLALHLKEQSPG